MHDAEPMPVMSNTELELLQHRAAIQRASFGGTVLACGLGLGCYVRACLAFEAVERVDVVELSPDVIALVAPSLAEHVSVGRLVIHEGDAFDFDSSGCGWDVAWLDVWARRAACLSSSRRLTPCDGALLRTLGGSAAGWMRSTRRPARSRIIG